MHVTLEIDGEPHDLWLARVEDKVRVEVDGQTLEAAVAPAGPSALLVTIAGRTRRVEVLGPGRARVDGAEVAFAIPAFAAGGGPGQHARGAQGPAKVKPPMPGRVAAVKVREGDQVQKGQVLLILEAMKMQNEVPAPTAGRVAKVHAREGQVVEPGHVLVEIEG